MKTKTLRMAALYLAAASVSLATASARDLFSGGKTDYTIVIPTTATQWEKLAATELHDALQKVGGVDMPIVSGDSTIAGPAVYVGYCHAVDSLTGKAKPDDEDDTFTYFTAGDNLYIYGSSKRGTLYGVYGFLENELGVHWYSPGCSVYPKTETYALREDMNHSESPAIKYRMTDPAIYDNTWAMRNRQNMQPGANGDFFAGYSGVHTMGWMLPASEYFESHPEYFAMRDGKRISDGQLCLSNPFVLRICTKKLLQWIADSPGLMAYSLSQNDNDRYCECSKCKAMEQKYGGHSGLMIRFVNQAAAEVKKKYPGVMVSTLAYLYTRTPPTAIKPADNVEIDLCDIECCFAHPLAEKCNNDSKTFLEDLEGWKKLTKNVFMWDYTVGYTQYLAPHPNFQVLAPNIRTFRDNNCIGLFEESAYNSQISEFQAMKSWVITKLLWNPELNTDSLVEEFANVYYGKAAPKILEYYRLCRAQVTPDTHFICFTYSGDALYSNPNFYPEGTRLLNEARQLAENDTIAMRVDCERLQMIDLHSDRDYDEAVSDGTWQEFKDLIQDLKDKWHYTSIRYKELQSIEDYFSTRFQRFAGDFRPDNYVYKKAPGYVGDKQAYDDLVSDYKALLAIANSATATEEDQAEIVKKIYADRKRAEASVIPLTDGVYYIQTGHADFADRGTMSWFAPYQPDHIGWAQQEAKLPFMWEIKKLDDGNYSIQNLSTGQYVNHSDVIDGVDQPLNLSNTLETEQQIEKIDKSGQFNIQTAGAKWTYNLQNGWATATSGPIASWSDRRIDGQGAWHLTPVPEEELAAARRLVGISQATAEGKTSVDVYSADGALISKDADAASATVGLPKGIYVAGKKKVLAK